MRVFLFLLTFMISEQAYAYIGPGMAGGALAAIIGFLGALLLLIFGVVYFPIKRYLHKKKRQKNETTSE